MQQPAATAAPAIRATWSDLSVTIDGISLLRDFSYAVPDGGIVGIVGPPGPLLTTTLLALAGRYPPASGSVAITGSPRTVALAHIDGPERPDPLLTVAETVRATTRPRTRSRTDQMVDWALSTVGMSARGDVRLGGLSDSDRLRVGIAGAAAAGAAVIVVDVSAIGAGAAAAEVWLLLKQLALGGRLVLAGSAVVHENMDLVITVPTTEVRT